ncbi:MAG: NAD(P)-dependent dehydrogenase (short-subunit alcohol dehydrogenase family) [Phenylobacterium sp.]|jgi:NAD(P)-dependent dehydrogenase (short-subunit alcohol dehydrogenase family)
MSKIVLITGGGRGIGAATARHLATLGYSICINYKSNQQSAESLLAELTAIGCNAIAIQADVSVESEVVALFEQIDNRLGPITALVNNAGILFQQTTVEHMTAERINKVLTTNVTSYFLCCREAIKRMATKNGGSGGAIVNVSSAASRIGAPNEYVDYAASKGAIDTLTTGLSLEVAAQGMRVNCVRPGCIYTQMHADGGEPGRVDRLKDAIPMKRGGEPFEVANAIGWLLSDEASYVTGSFIDLAGGR